MGLDLTQPMAEIGGQLHGFLHERRPLIVARRRRVALQDRGRLRLVVGHLDTEHLEELARRIHRSTLVAPLVHRTLLHVATALSRSLFTSGTCAKPSASPNGTRDAWMRRRIAAA